MVGVQPPPELELPEPLPEDPAPSSARDASDGGVTPEPLVAPPLPLDPELPMPPELVDPDEPPELEAPVASEPVASEPVLESEDASSPWARLLVFPPHAPGRTMAAAISEVRSDRRPFLGRGIRAYCGTTTGQAAARHPPTPATIAARSRLERPLDGGLG
jgi:hypothetical protein